MSVFTNEATIKGRINKLHYHDGGDNAVLYLTIGVKSDYTKDNTTRYYPINAQINVKLDKEGKPTCVSSSAKSKLNLDVFNYLNNNALKGMHVQLRGNLRGADLVFIENEKKWKSYSDLTEEEKAAAATNKNNYKNVTFIYIEHAQLLEKKANFIENQRIEQQNSSNIQPVVPKDTKEADYLPDDEDEESEGIEVVVEPPTQTSSVKHYDEEIVDGEATVIDRRNNGKEGIRSYVAFENTDYGREVPDFPEPELNIYP